MSKMPKNLRYCDKLADGRYVLLVRELPEGQTRIIFVGGTSITDPTDEPLELRKAA